MRSVRRQQALEQLHHQRSELTSMPSVQTVGPVWSESDAPSTVVDAPGGFQGHLAALAAEYDQVVVQNQRFAERISMLCQEVTSLNEQLAPETVSPALVVGSNINWGETELVPGLTSPLRVSNTFLSSTSLLDDLPTNLSASETSRPAQPGGTPDASAAAVSVLAACGANSVCSILQPTRTSLQMSSTDASDYDSRSPTRIITPGGSSREWANPLRDPKQRWEHLTMRLLRRSEREQRRIHYMRDKSAAAMSPIISRRAVSRREVSQIQSDTSSIRSGFQLDLYPEWCEVLSRASTTGTGAHPMDYSTTLGQFQARPEAGKPAQDVTRAGDIMQDENNLLQRFMLRPSSLFRVAWDMTSAVLLAYDIIVIPLSIFPLPDHAILDIMVWLSTLYWTVDVMMSFLTGYNVNGVVELRPGRVGRHYVRTWFLMDIFIVASDWLVLAEVGDSVDVMGIMRIGKSFRMTRVLRTLRLLRIMRYLRTVEVLWYLTRSQVPATVASITKFLLGMIVVNHFVACGWYGLGDWDIESNTWLVEFRSENSEASVLYLYFTCLHWALTQFTPASMQVHAVNALERIYTIVVLVISLVMLSSIISSLTSAVTHLRRIRSEKTRERELAKQYLIQKRVSLELGNRILDLLKQHDYNTSSAKRPREQDVVALKYLPDPLRMTLRFEIYMPVLTPHPFFRHLHDHDFNAVAKTCHGAMQEHCLSLKEEVFHCGQKADGAFFVTSGTGRYFKGMEISEAEGVEVKMDHSSAIAMMALWVYWEHRGRLIGWNCLDLVSLDSEKFRAIAMQSHIASFCRNYAQISRARYMHQGELYDTWYDVELEWDIVRQAWHENGLSPSASEELTPKGRDSRDKLTSRISNWLNFGGHLHLSHHTPPPSPGADQLPGPTVGDKLSTLPSFRS